MRPERQSRSGLPDRWFATDGVSALGPLSFDAVMRAVVHGDVLAGCLVRHAYCNRWQPLDQVQRLSAQERAQRLATLCELSARTEAEPQSSATRAASRSAPASDPRHTSSHPSMRPGSIDPAGVMATAEDFPGALLLALSTATATASAPAGLIIRVDASRSQVFGTQGRNTERLLGQSIGDGDASLSAAQRGAIVMGEATLGEAETCIAERLMPGAAPPQGVAMVPLLVDGELVAAVEMAHTTRPFRAREVARVEDVMEALASRAVVMGWFS
jgi:hypothetical protein